MTMPSSRSHADWIDREIRRMTGGNASHLLTTEQVGVAFQNAHLRVEQNLVSNVATFERRLDTRISLADDSHYLAVLIPVLNDGRLVLLGRYRYAINCWSIEFPRARFQTARTSWVLLAEQQLLKDTGLKAEGFRLLGTIQNDPAILSISTVVVLAENCLSQGLPSPDPRESIVGSVALTLDELDQVIREGNLACGTTLAALCLYRSQLIAR